MARCAPRVAAADAFHPEPRAAHEAVAFHSLEKILGATRFKSTARSWPTQPMQEGRDDQLIKSNDKPGKQLHELNCLARNRAMRLASSFFKASCLSGELGPFIAQLPISRLSTCRFGDDYHPNAGNHFWPRLAHDLPNASPYSIPDDCRAHSSRGDDPYPGSTFPLTLQHAQQHQSSMDGPPLLLHPLELCGANQSRCLRKTQTRLPVDGTVCRVVSGWRLDTQARV
jgi:hypothetical protein